MESLDLRSAGKTTKSPDVQSRGKFLNLGFLSKT